MYRGVTEGPDHTAQRQQTAIDVASLRTCKVQGIKQLSVTWLGVLQTLL